MFEIIHEQWISLFPVTEHGNRSIIRKASQVSFLSKTSSNSNTAPAQNTAAVNHTQQKTATAPTTCNQKTVVSKTSTTVAKRPTQLPTQSSFTTRRVVQAKQVSFSDVDNGSSTVATSTEDQILTLTTKNLNMYNAMVLKTIRTQKFDER